MRCCIVIPARMASTRFPGKPLCDLGGKPMIQWVVEAALRANITETVVVATPDAEIMDTCDRLGFRAIMTSPDHPSGTDRIAEVAQAIVANVYVNVQGDEPLIPHESIRACAEPLLNDPNISMGSLWAECDPKDYDNPAVVKAVTDRHGNALYFSRHCIPFPRNPRIAPVKRHVGIYSYRRDVLEAYATWSQTPLEIAESLEQLRFLENGVQIRLSEGKISDVGVDTPEQAEEVRRLIAERKLA
jgi:3-deoxy-manno-octulosonate cytidylyltransferase (CMP-KDO synthetase)